MDILAIPGTTHAPPFDLSIPLTMKEMCDLAPEHLYSETGVEERPVRWRPDDGAVVGFTEWSADRAGQSISFGWDWRYETRSGLMIGRWKSLRTNTRITDEAGNAVCDRLAWLCVASVMGRAHWGGVVAHTLGLRGLQH